MTTQETAPLETHHSPLAANHSNCEACGSPLEPFDKFCPACGTTNVVAAEVIAAPAAPPQKHFRCESCGAEVQTDPAQRSYTCPFCDSTYVIEVAATARQEPEFVIGFAIAPDEAREKFRQWLGDNTWYRPGDLKLAQIEERLKGVYLPFWHFSMLAQSRWSANIGIYWYRTETYTTTDSKGRLVTRTRRVQETEWSPLAGNHHRYYSGYLISGSKGLPQAQANRILPFNLPALKRYEPFYLAGWLSEEYSIERDEALQQCFAEFHRRERQNIAAFMPGDTHASLDVNTEFGNIDEDLCLLPVYLLSYRYGDKVYRFLMNGQTGRMAGDKPLSWNRIGIAIGVSVGLVLLFIVAMILVRMFG